MLSRISFGDGKGLHFEYFESNILLYKLFCRFPLIFSHLVNGIASLNAGTLLNYFFKDIFLVHNPSR